MDGPWRPPLRGRVVVLLWVCLAALGCADGDVQVGEVQPLVDPTPDGGFIVVPIPGSLDAEAGGEPDRALPDAAGAPNADAELPPRDARAPDPPPGTCRDDADCPAGRICVGDVCAVAPGALERVGDGACTNAADELQLGNGIDLRELATACTVGCLGEKRCIVDCVRMNTTFSPACGGCVGELVACILSACFLPCTWADYLTCLDCREAACDPGFERCAGYRVPPGW
ncbi:MAG: hypothetical protein H6704_24455 [Myxococcales bacterium]|nr:hypothetical protein [Myxococcales bacterium]